MKNNQTTTNAATIATASGIASYASPGLAEGEYRMHFECSDNAGNVGKGVEVTVKSERKSLSLTLTFNKENFYPNENFEPRIKVTDSEGVIITDAAVNGILTYSSGTKPISFFYSSLCDCYKAFFWFSESYVTGQYTLNVTASGTNYKAKSMEKSFLLIKPSLKLSINTDKTEYNPGDSASVSVTATDSEGNKITDVHVSGDVRDASTNALVSTIYPSYKDGYYVYDYYVGSESLGKSLKISVESTWKEQKASASIVISVTKRGLNGDVVLEKDVLAAGDILRGKIRVFDKNGATISDAYVTIEISGPYGNSTSAGGTAAVSAVSAKYKTGGFSFTVNTKYKDGFYYIDDFRIPEQITSGKYDIRIKISKKDETVEIVKTITILKENLNIDIVFDKTTYAPGGRVNLRILVTYPDGSVIKDAYISGEIFPLEQTTRELEGWKEPPSIKTCRMYVYPIGPIHYKESFVQKYYIDDVYIPAWCPIGKYVARIKVGKAGYEETEYTEEFDVTLGKLILETGFKIDSQQNQVNLIIYAETKDETGNFVNARVRGYLNPLSNVTCIKEIYMSYEGYESVMYKHAATHKANVVLSKAECPAGDYVLDLTASEPSYLEANITQVFRIEYKEGYEYGVYVPPVVTGTPTCKEISCGPNCVQKICSVAPETCPTTTVVDKACLNKCQSDASELEKAYQGSAEFDMKVCVNNCTKQVGCEEISAVGSGEMLNKLEEIKNELVKTREQVGAIESILRTLMNFLMSIAQGMGFASQPPAMAPGATVTTIPA